MRKVHGLKAALSPLAKHPVKLSVSFPVSKYRLLFRETVVLAIAALFPIFVGPARAADRQVLDGHVPQAVARLTPVDRLPPLKRLNLALGLPLRNRDALTTLLQQLYDPASPGYRKWLTPAEFAEKFGPTEQDYQAVVDFAEANGLRVAVKHPNRVVLDVEGAVADIEKALHLTLRVYQHPNEPRSFYAPDAEPSLDLTVPILDIGGLDTYALPHPRHKVQPAGKPGNATPNAGSGPGGSYRGSDFRAAYLPGVALNGSGQSVGLLQFDGYYANDITTYESQAGLPNVTLVNVPIDGGVSTPGSGNGEVCLDIEMVISMAPGISKIYVYEAPNPSPWVDLLSRMANDNLARQLSCSWGGGGPNATAEQIFQQMAAQGQSFFNASGDSDAFTSSITFPSDSTNITQVGGTTLTTTGPGGAYVSETVWNWGLVQGSYVGSSGGISTFYSIPSYQLGISMAANQGSTTKRNVPDVALTGDNVYVVYNNGGSGAFGGTSCAAPLWAGFTALINQQAVANGVPTAGFINPAIYTIGKGASYASDFHDTTTGNNFSSSSPTKFAAVSGYDLCTGWGTPIGSALINALAGPPAPDIVSNSLALVAESCLNNAVDPGETVTINFGLKNVGSAGTSNLVATLQAGGGVSSPSAPQVYGALSGGGGAASHSFSLTATGACGGMLTATLQLQDGATSLGSVSFGMRLGIQTVATPLVQNFDAVTAPALPAGWSSALVSGSQADWAASAAANDSAPNAAFIADSPNLGENALVSPAFVIASSSAQLTFRQNYNLENHRHGASTVYYDGGVLEIKIGAGAFTDIVSAGGSFVTGGYNVSLASGNPLAGRQAWGGSSGGWLSTTVNLPATAAGQTVQLRWACAVNTGNANGGVGWYVDSTALSDTVMVCCTPGPDLAVSQSAAPNPGKVGQNLTYTLATTNLGALTASAVTLTDALPSSVSFVSASPGCTNIGGVVTCNLGALAGGAGSNITVTVTPSIAGPITNSVTIGSTTADPNSANNTATNVITVIMSPSITVPPATQTVLPGTNVTFLVTASGTAPLRYQWTFRGTNLAAGTTHSLVLTNVQLPQAGNYAVVVTNLAGAVTSAPASLRILAAPILGGISRVGGTASISVVSVAGLDYTLEYKNSFDESNWTPLPPAVAGTGGPVALQDTNSPVASRFYRVRCE